MRFLSLSTRTVHAAGLLVVLALCGCGAGAGADDRAPLHGTSDAAFQAAEGTRTQALALLDSVRLDTLRGAFAHMDRLGYRWHVRTEQRAPEPAPRLVAFEERTARHPAGGGPLRVLQKDSSGTFDFGVLGRFVSTSSGTAPATDLAQQALAEEPAFLSERNRHAFQYRLLPDTTLSGGVGRARVVAVRARPTPDGDKQAIRGAQLYLKPDTGTLVALRLRRQRAAMLFNEGTRLLIRLRRATAPPDSIAWVPAETRFDTRLDLPLRPARRFRSVSHYDQYRSASS